MDIRKVMPDPISYISLSNTKFTIKTIAPKNKPKFRPPLAVVFNRHGSVMHLFSLICAMVAKLDPERTNCNDSGTCRDSNLSFDNGNGLLFLLPTRYS